MNLIKKMYAYIKNIFFKQEEVKKLPEPTNTIEQNKKEEFLKDLKVTPKEKSPKENIETLICYGDGLGIQKTITS